MLVLSLKTGGECLIDNKIKVTVISAVNGKVKLGFEASREISIIRTDAKKKEK